MYECRILAENVLHEGLRVKLENLIPGSNTRQVSVVGVNKIKDMIRTVGWIPHKGIMYAMPIKEDWRVRPYSAARESKSLCISRDISVVNLSLIHI